MLNVGLLKTNNGKDKIMNSPVNSPFGNLYNSKWIDYKDETWNRVINASRDRKRAFLFKKIRTTDNYCRNEKVVFKKNEMHIKSIGIQDDWIYMTDTREFPTFELSMDAIFYSSFNEIQFGFRHVDFYNRYRFKIQSGFIHFDIIYKGKFFKSLFKIQFEPKIGLNYKFTIRIDRNKYYFYINQKKMLGVQEKIPVLRSGTYAIILWDPSGNSNIQANYKNITLRNI